MTQTFEALRSRIGSLIAPTDQNARQVYWIDESGLGVAVDPRGAFELFLVRERLHSRLAVVSRHLEFDSWTDANGAVFVANRLVFPAAPHFLGFSALVAMELLQAGWGESDARSHAAFATAEPLIEMALRRAALSNDAVLGLLGELLVLEQILLTVGRSRPELFSAVLDSWRGYTKAARDFSIGDVALEIKTTSLPVSEHSIHSLAQVEPSDQGESRLMLLSISLVASSAEGFSLPQVVTRIVNFLQPQGVTTAVATRFLHDVTEYARGDGLGYDHDTMKTWPAYQHPYLLGFAPRLYDMADPNIRLVRRADLCGTFVNPDAIQYQVQFPARVSDGNPHEDWMSALRSLTYAAFGGR